MKPDKKTEPFKMPEGYLDNFAQNLMAMIPEQPQPMAVQRRRSLVPWYSAAAVALLLGLSSVVYFQMSAGRTDNVAGVNDSSRPLYSVDDIADYAMLDHQDIYEIVSE